MKRIFLVFITVASTTYAVAQQTPQKKDFSKINFDRAGDHIMIGFSGDIWTANPDSIRTNMHGFSRGLNIAVMFDKRLKTNPYVSYAFGLGISNSNMFFKNMGPSPEGIQVASPGNATLAFTATTGDHFKKYKLANTFLEVPVEMRYTFDPVNENKSWKMALGLKFGLLVDAHTKGKTLQSFNGVTENNYIEKESSTRYFNEGRVAVTGRFGYGHFSVFGSYSIVQLMRYGNVGVRPLQIGIMISGL